MFALCPGGPLFSSPRVGGPVAPSHSGPPLLRCTSAQPAVPSHPALDTPPPSLPSPQVRLSQRRHARAHRGSQCSPALPCSAVRTRAAFAGHPACPVVDCGLRHQQPQGPTLRGSHHAAYPRLGLAPMDAARCAAPAEMEMRVPPRRLRWDLVRTARPAAASISAPCLACTQRQQRHQHRHQRQRAPGPAAQPSPGASALLGQPIPHPSQPGGQPANERSSARSWILAAAPTARCRTRCSAVAPPRLCVFLPSHPPSISLLLFLFPILHSSRLHDLLTCCSPFLGPVSTSVDLESFLQKFGRLDFLDLDGLPRCALGRDRPADLDRLS